MYQDNDVIHAFLKLSRAMRRCPPDRVDFPFPPAIGRLLECAASHPGVSSRELGEILDLRPSSLSEMLTRAEGDGLITRNTDETDRRIQRISLSEKGQSAVSEMEACRRTDADKKTACLTEQEKAQFCELCNRLSEHIEKLALDLPEDRMPPRHRHGRPPFDHGCLPPRRPRDPEEPDRDDRPPFPPGVRFKS